MMQSWPLRQAQGRPWDSGRDRMGGQRQLFLSGPRQLELSIGLTTQAQRRRPRPPRRSPAAGRRREDAPIGTEACSRRSLERLGGVLIQNACGIWTEVVWRTGCRPPRNHWEQEDTEVTEIMSSSVSSVSSCSKTPSTSGDAQMSTTPDSVIDVRSASPDARAAVNKLPLRLCALASLR